MAYISRLLNKRISNLISKFNVSTKNLEQFENDYPLDGIGDCHRYFL